MQKFIGGIGCFWDETKYEGLIRAISKNYKKSYPPSEKFLNRISKKHSGYRTVFTWYMWRSIDPVDVEY